MGRRKPLLGRFGEKRLKEEKEREAVPRKKEKRPMGPDTVTLFA